MWTAASGGVSADLLDQHLAEVQARKLGGTRLDYLLAAPAPLVGVEDSKGRAAAGSEENDGDLVRGVHCSAVRRE